MIPQVRRLDGRALIHLLRRLELFAPPPHVEAVQKDPFPVDLVIGRIVLALVP